MRTLALILASFIFMPHGLPAKLLKETLSDDRPGIALLEAELGSCVREKDHSKIESIGIGFLNPDQHWDSGAPKIRSYFEILGMENAGEEIGEELWLARQAFLESWQKAAPQSHLPPLALSRFFYHFAFHARGDESEESVSDADMRSFRQRIKASEKYLAMARELKADDLDPIYHLQMLMLAVEQRRSPKDMVKIYEDCRKKFPYFFTLSSELYLVLAYRMKDPKVLILAFRKDMERDPKCAAWGVMEGIYRLSSWSQKIPWLLFGYATRDAFWAALLPGINRLNDSYRGSVQDLNTLVVLADQLGIPEKAAPWIQKLEGRFDSKKWEEVPDGEARFRELDAKYRLATAASGI